MYVDVHGNEKGGVMAKKNTLRARLVKEYEKGSKSALRDPRTVEQMAMRLRWERLHSILRRRYDYLPGMQR